MIVEFTTITKETLETDSTSGGVGDLTLEIEADPTQTFPGSIAIIRASHPQAWLNPTIRLSATAGLAMPFESGEVGFVDAGIPYTEGKDEILTFEKSQASTSKRVSDLATFTYTWMGTGLGVVTVSTSDFQTLNATPGGDLGIAQVRYNHNWVRWGTTCTSNMTQGILATAGNYRGSTEVKYEDGETHGQTGLTLVASPDNPGVNQDCVIRLYTDPLSLMALTWNWETTFGVLGAQTADDESITRENITVTGSAFDVERPVVRVLEVLTEPAYDPLIIWGTPPKTRHFTANQELAIGTLSYESTYYKRTLRSNIAGTAFVTVSCTVGGFEEVLSVQFGPPTGPKDITVTIKDIISDTNCGSGIMVTVGGDIVKWTDGNGQIRISSIAPGKYSLWVHDPSNVYQDSKEDGLANDWLEIVG